MARKSKQVMPAAAAAPDRSLSISDMRALLYKRGNHASIVDECIRSPFIEYGYRKTKSIRDTFFTLFSFHNETMNIWSHLIGFFCVLVAGYHVALEMWNTQDHHIVEIIAFESFIMCAAVCLGLISVYHWFGCISEAYHNCLLKLDVTGIGLLVTGSFVPGIYYGTQHYADTMSMHVMDRLTPCTFCCFDSNRILLFAGPPKDSLRSHGPGVCDRHSCAMD